MEDKVLSHAVLQDQLSSPKNGESAHKHLKQQVQKHLNTQLIVKSWTGGSVVTHTPVVPVGPVLNLRSPGGAGAAGRGAVLCGVRSRPRETLSLDP